MKVTLYFGDNNAHQFWESEDKKFLFIRNHGEQYWQALYVGGDFLNLSALSVKALVRKIRRDYDYQFAFNTDSRWLKLYSHHRNMRLVSIPQPAF